MDYMEFLILSQKRDYKGIGSVRGYIEFRGITPAVENQMEKKMEHDMKTRTTS